MTVTELAAQRQDKYKLFVQKFAKIRTCTICGALFSHMYGLGHMHCLSGKRDHVDCESEPVEQWNEFLIPYDFLMCMASGKLLIGETLQYWNVWRVDPSETVTLLRGGVLSKFEFVYSSSAKPEFLKVKRRVQDCVQGVAYGNITN